MIRIVALRRHDDDGFALVLVVGSMLILAMLAMTGLAYVARSAKFARYDQDYSASMTAAQSGVEDFISRLNRDDTYGTVVDCTNPAWQGPTTLYNLCDWNSTTTPGWAPVTPGVTGPSAAAFHYSVDATNSAATGVMMVTATGRVNGEYRTVETAVGKGGSTDYVYYTDFESADPTNVQAYPGAVPTACGGSGYANAKYFYGGRSGQGCVEIAFISADTLSGSVFTNDAILSDGAHFLNGVETANPTCDNATANPSTWNNCLRSGSTADFNAIQPLRKDPHYLDDTSAGFANYAGCHYFGSTRVVFNSSGTMTVWNKRSNNGSAAGSSTGVGAPLAIAPPGGTAPSCGSLADLDSLAGATVAVPNEMVIYVAASSAAQRQCYGGEIGGPTSPAGRTLPLGTYSAAYAAGPTASGQSYTLDTNMTETTKSCSAGNLYIEGTLKGRTTVSAAQSVIVTGDLVKAGGQGGPDMLGLVATNSVEVFHPQVGTITSKLTTSGCSRNCTYSWGSVAGAADVPGWPTRYVDPTTGGLNPSSGVQIAGSIQTLQHSFLVQKYAYGAPAGTLYVFGSIAQRWRGIVGQSGSPSTGYNKQYQYDPRLQYSSPPYFPRWTNSQWSLRYSGEVNTSSAVRSLAP